MERTISSLTHPIVKHLVSLRDSASYRDINNGVLVQGSKLIGEVGRQHAVRVIVTSDRSLVPHDLEGSEVILASEAILHKVSGVMTAEGIVAEVQRPVWSSMERFTRVLALDGVGDPGNLGTLIRTALALGWQGLYLLEGSCDPYNDKALRAAMGATFRLPMARGTWEELQKLAVSRHLTMLAGDVEGVPVGQASWDAGVVLVLGGEAKGLSPAVRQQCRAVTIPMAGQMESLNVAVAGGILMYVLGHHNG